MIRKILVAARFPQHSGACDLAVGPFGPPFDEFGKIVDRAIVARAHTSFGLFQHQLQIARRCQQGGFIAINSIFLRPFERHPRPPL